MTANVPAKPLFGRCVLATFRKELRIELRTKEVLSTTLLFALLVSVLASMSLYLNPVLSTKVAPPALWISIAFCGIMAVSRSWARERESGVFGAALRSPAPAAAIYLGKTLAIFVFVTVVVVALLLLISLFFNLELLTWLGPLSLILFLGVTGFVFSASFFGALTVGGTARDLTLSTVVFPLVTPSLLGATVATRDLFSGASLGDLGNWLRLLAVYDLVFIAAGLLLFESVVRER